MARLSGSRPSKRCFVGAQGTLVRHWRLCFFLGGNTIKGLIALSCLLVLVLGVGALGCAGLSFQRIDLKDLPKTPLEATVYRSGTKGLAVILDESNDGVVATVSNENFRAKKDGLKVPQGYLEDFIWTPDAYLL